MKSGEWRRLRLWVALVVLVGMGCSRPSPAPQKPALSPARGPAKGTKGYWRKRLKAPHFLKRLDAIEELTRKGAASIPLLSEATRHRHRRTRMAATLALRKLGAALALLKLLDSPYSEIRLLAAASFDTLSRPGVAWYPKLLKALKESEDPGVRAWMSRSLCKVGSVAIPGLLSLLETQAPSSRPSSPTGSLRRALRQGSGDEAFRSLQCLNPSSPAQLLRVAKLAARADTLRALMSMALLEARGAKADKAWSYLLRHRAPQVRSMALSRLSRLPPYAKATWLPQLRGELRSKQPTNRRRAATAMGRWGKGCEPCQKALFEGLSDPEPRVRHAAMVSLARLGAPASKLVPLLQKQLQSPAPAARSGAALSLGYYPSHPGLLSLLQATHGKEKDPGTRRAVLRSYGRLAAAKQPRAVGLLLEVLGSARAVLGEKLVATEALGHSKVAYGQVVGGLKRALKAPAPRLRAAAGKALQQLGLPATPALEALRQAFEKETHLLTKESLRRAILELRMVVQRSPQPRR